MPSAAELITRHFGGDWHGQYGTFPTPGHSDADRGMSISDADNGDVLINSFNGGDAVALKQECRRLGLLSDLHPSGERRETKFHYRGLERELLYRTVRIDQPGRKKTFRAQRPDGAGGWLNGLKDVPRVLYRLPELLAADKAEPIYLAEGERKADRLAAMGFVATACAFGAKGWRDDYAATLTGRTVAILPDNDQEGRDFADRARRSIEAAGGKALLIELPGLPPKGDIVDWTGTVEQLRDLTAQALAAARPAGLPVELFDDIRPVLDRRDLVTGLLPLGANIVVFGQPGCGKSFLALDLGLHIAAGQAWLTRPVQQGGVVYVAAEVDVWSKAVARRDGAGALQILPVGDAIGLHGKTALFVGYDEIHGYRGRNRITKICH